MYAKRTVVKNKTGLHARPASDFVSKAKEFKSRVKIANVTENADERVNAKSIVAVLSLSMGQGTEVEITAEGADETEAVDALVALIDSGFDEE